MTPEPSIRNAARRPARARLTALGLLALLSWTLAGCGDPGGGGGGGYVSSQSVVTSHR